MASREFEAGLFGGITGTLISHPLDTLRVRKQLGNGLKGNVYNGLVPPLIGIGLEKLIVFGLYHHIKYFCISTNETANQFGSGMLSGLACTSVVVPLERLKIILQNNTNKDFKISSEIMKGRLLYRGWSSTLVREVPGYGFYFTIYDYLRTNTEDFRWYHSFLYGGLAGAGSWSIIYPSDVIKTNMQRKGNMDGLIKTARYIYRDGGIARFYRGFMLAVMRAFVLHSGVFAGYEFYMNNR